MQSAKAVLVMGEPGQDRNDVVKTLAACGVACATCRNLQEATALITRQNFEAVLCSDTLPGVSLDAVVRTARPAPVVVISRVAEWPAYLAALRKGAFDYIACPPDQAETERILTAALSESSRQSARAMSAA